MAIRKRYDTGDGQDLNTSVVEAAKQKVLQNIPGNGSQRGVGNTALASPIDGQPGMNDLLRETAYEDAIRASISDPGVNYLDYKALESDSPITQQGYSGKTFSMPTIAAGGVVVPFNILEKKQRAYREQEKRDMLDSIRLDYQVQEIKDVASNKIFIDKQLEYYNNLAKNIADQNFDGNIGRAYKYLNQEKNALAISGMKWKNLKNAFDSAYDNYVKLKSDPASLGTSAYSRKTKNMMAGFEEILDGENFNPDMVQQYSDFLRNFNRRSTINEITLDAAKNVKDVYRVQVEQLIKTGDYDLDAVRKIIDLDDDALEVIFQQYGGSDEDYTKEEKQLFKDAFKYNFEREVISDVRAVGKENIGAILLKNKLAADRENKKYDYPESKFVVTEYGTDSEDYGSPVGLRGVNAVTLPSDKKLQIGIPIKGDSGLAYAVSKTTGQPVSTKKNVDFEPRNTAIYYVLNKDLYKTDPNTGKQTDEVLIKAGMPITTDKEELCYFIQDSPGIEINRVRFVEGTISKKEPDAADKGTDSVLVPYKWIEGDMRANYPNLSEKISSADQFEKENPVRTVAGYNAFQKNKDPNFVPVTKEDLQANYPQYIWIEGTRPASY